MLCEMIFKQSCGISLVDGTARCPIGGDLDQREWPAKLCIVVHGGSCCLQSTSAKKSLSAFSRSRRHQIRILFYYSTTYRTQFQYIFMPPPVKCSFKPQTHQMLSNAGDQLAAPCDLPPTAGTQHVTMATRGYRLFYRRERW